MKNKVLTATLLLLMVSCSKEDKPKYEVYENHDVTICEIKDPLENISWIKAKVNEDKNSFLSGDYKSMSLELYRNVDTKELFILESKEYYLKDDSPTTYPQTIYNCLGEIILKTNIGINGASSALSYINWSKKHLQEANLWKIEMNE